MQPLRVAVHLLLDDVQLQLDPELPPAGPPISSPVPSSMHLFVLHFAHDALVFRRHHACHSSVPLLSRSSSVWKANPSASPEQSPLSFEVLPSGCLCCLCPQVLPPCAFTSCSVHYLPGSRVWNTLAAPNVHFAILFKIVQPCYQRKQIEWMKLIEIKYRE